MEAALTPEYRFGLCLPGDFYLLIVYILPDAGNIVHLVLPLVPV